MLRTDPEQSRIPRTDIDKLSIADAAEMIASFCLAATDGESEGYAVRELDDQFTAAVELKQADGIEDESEIWVSRVRVTRSGNPFDACSGIEIKLPWGIDLNPGTGEDTKHPYLHQSPQGVYASYPYDGMGLNGHRLRLPLVFPEEITVDNTSVAEVDTILELGRPDIPHEYHEWAGVFLGDVVQHVSTT